MKSTMTAAELAAEPHDLAERNEVAVLRCDGSRWRWIVGASHWACVGRDVFECPRCGLSFTRGADPAHGHPADPCRPDRAYVLVARLVDALGVPRALLDRPASAAPAVAAIALPV